MENGLETKDINFPSQLALPYPQKSWINHNNAESAVKHCLLIMDGNKVVNINP